MAWHGRQDEMRCFEEFIAEAGLVDLQMVRRKYTWYRSDGGAMSRLDKFLVFEAWLNTWTNSSEWGLQIGLSDHCAVMLRDKVIDWGPKPFRMLNCWREVLGYAEFVKNERNVMSIEGWGAFVLKEKLKLIK